MHYRLVSVLVLALLAVCSNSQPVKHVAEVEDAALNTVRAAALDTQGLFDALGKARHAVKSVSNFMESQLDNGAELTRRIAHRLQRSADNLDSAGTGLNRAFSKASDRATEAGHRAINEAGEGVDKLTQKMKAPFQRGVDSRGVDHRDYDRMRFESGREGPEPRYNGPHDNGHSYHDDDLYADMLGSGRDEVLAPEAEAPVEQPKAPAAPKPPVKTGKEARRASRHSPRATRSSRHHTSSMRMSAFDVSSGQQVAASNKVGTKTNRAKRAAPKLSKAAQAAVLRATPSGLKKVKRGARVKSMHA